MEQMMEYIRPELLVLVQVLYFVGMGLKKSTYFNDNAIPLLLGVFGVLLSLLYVMATVALGSWQDILLAAFTALTQGVLCAGASVYVNQLIKQTKDK